MVPSRQPAARPKSAFLREAGRSVTRSADAPAPVLLEPAADRHAGVKESPDSEGIPSTNSAAVVKKPPLYLNPELSLLQFQRRVLEEARDPGNPLLERVKFLSILSSNLDEFFMVRVAGLLQQIESGVQEPSIDGQLPGAQLEAIRWDSTGLLTDAYTVYQAELLPALAAAGITISNYRSLDSSQQRELETYFRESIYPVLTPLAFDRGRPFPHISNLSLNLAVVVRDATGAEHFARVKVPDTIHQLVAVRACSGWGSTGQMFVWIEDLVLANLHFLFPGLQIVEAHPFHVTRDAEVAIKEIETDDLLATIEEAVWRRRFRDVVRLLVDTSMPRALLEILTTNLEIEPAGVYRVRGPLNLGRLRQLTGLDRAELKDRPFAAANPLVCRSKDQDFFSAIREEDILLHHPFDSFQPVVDFLNSAGRDPDVLAIKMTLYRLGRNSPVVDALLEAVKNGKQVAVVVELQARFDEESNIEWARALERQGVHVVHGLSGLKVHSKVALVVRQEGSTIRRYLHLATGNYNPTTAHLYTDIGIFTCDAEIGADATALFNYLTGYSATQEFNKLLVAPVNLRRRLAELIRREIDQQKCGRRGRLIFKMNALDDPGVMRLLCEASSAGVQVDLLVRGICCLRPGVPGVSDNIRVRSVVGRFLEHSRVYFFQNGGKEEIYVGSADMMPRNLDRRVEVLFPVRSPRLIGRLKEILDQYLLDDVTVRRMRSDGSYTLKPREGRIDSQACFLGQSTRRETAVRHMFEPRSVDNGAAVVEHLGVAPSLTRAALRDSADRLAAEIRAMRERLGVVDRVNRG